MKTSQGLSALRASARLTFAAIAASTFSLPTFAEEHFDTLTVTTNRMPSDNLLAATTVITRADIERSQINDLPTLLSRQPGIDMSFDGGAGKSSDLYMRGTSSGHVLFLVDGVKWHSATLGETSIQNFPVEQIERVEIVRGPRSGIYGSEAIGGVIQIFTRQGQQGIKPYAKVSSGTHNTKQASVGVSGGNESTTYNLSFNHQSTDGIHAREDKNTDHDGYRNKSVSAKINHKLTKDISVGANFLRAESKNDYDGYSISADYHGESVQQVLGANTNWQVNDAWLLSFQLSESRDKSEDFKDHISSSEINTRHRFVNITNTVELNPNHTLNLGLDYENDYVDSSKDYLETSRDNKAVFLSWQGNQDKNSWLVSARHDDNESFGTHNTGTAEWGYWLQENLQITANYGTAFKAPSFNDLYWPDTGSSVGNLSILPEESRSWGLSLNGSAASFDWGINVYKTKIKNLIDWKKVNGKWTPSNVSKAEIKGIEFAVSTNVLGADIAFDASFLQPEDEETGKTLTGRAKRLANLHIDNQWDEWSLGASWKLSGHRYDDESNNNRLGGFGLVDIRASYKVAKDWSLQANVSNLFDKEYQTNDGYNSLDRVAMFTILYQPK
ncbi:cobalamin receptor [Methylophaga sp. 42_25_T18]|nr:cobalamin receptor [Methylophaga sp. 42_25_T18]OUR88527.1 cobalamin receptor [Methylophaga sp. 42_8_T64]